MIAVSGGVVSGMVLAAIGSVLIAQFLFQVAPRASGAYAGAALVVIGVAAVASWLPIHGLSRLPLAEVLRQE